MLTLYEWNTHTNSVCNFVTMKEECWKSIVESRWTLLSHSPAAKLLSAKGTWSLLLWHPFYDPGPGRTLCLAEQLTVCCLPSALMLRNQLSHFVSDIFSQLASCHDVQMQVQRQNGAWISSQTRIKPKPSSLYLFYAKKWWWQKAILAAVTTTLRLSTGLISPSIFPVC